MVMNLIWRDTVTRKGSLLTNIMSTRARVIDVLMTIQYGWWNRVNARGDMGGWSVNCFSFKAAKIGAKNISSNADVVLGDGTVGHVAHSRDSHLVITGMHDDIASGVGFGLTRDSGHKRPHGGCIMNGWKRQTA